VTPHHALLLDPSLLILHPPTTGGEATENVRPSLYVGGMDSVGTGDSVCMDDSVSMGDSVSDSMGMDDSVSIEHNPDAIAGRDPVDTEHGPLEHGPLEHGPLEHGPLEHRPLEHRSLERGPLEHGSLEHRLVEHRRAMTGSMAQLLDLVWELDSADDHPTAYPDAATWLTWNLGLSGRTSRLWVRAAKALRDLPALRSALASGLISFDQLQVLVKVATPENEQHLVEVARQTGSVDELRDEIIDRAEVPADPRPDPVPAWLETWWDAGRLHLEGHVAGADGVVVEKAILRLKAKAPRDPSSGLFRDPGVLAGEALLQMASESIAADGDHDRATVVVHMAAADLLAGQGEGWDAAVRLFPIAELERLACDGRLQPAVHDSGGVTVGVGRVTRKILPWLRRLMEGRDQGCRFPGCRRTRWLHGHHIVPWSQGGPTNLDNLVSLCGFHHRLIHRDAWTIVGDPNASLEFHDKWGELHSPAMGHYPPNWVDTLLEQIEGYGEYRLGILAGSDPP